MLEVASEFTAHKDYTVQRTAYAQLGVPEYWRFDYTGGKFNGAPLSGDRLSDDGIYQPIPLTTELDGVIRGYSEALDLSLCWVAGRLRYRDRVRGRYLPDSTESEARANAAESRANAAEARAEAEIRARARAEAEARANAAEARARMLEQELRRRETP